MAAKKKFSWDDNRTWVLETDSILYNSLKITLRNLQIYGMYPINNVPKWVYYCHAGLLHCTLTLPIPLLVFAYMFVYRKTLDLETVIDLLFMVMELAIAIPKYSSIRLYPEKVRCTLEWLNIKEFNTYHPDQEKIAKWTSDLFKKVFYYFLVACTVTLFILIFKPLLMGKKILQTEIWLPFDPLKNNYIFVSVYILVGIGITNTGFGNCSVDCIIAGLLLHATGQIKIIKGTLKDVIKHAEERVSDEHRNVSRTEFETLKHKYVYKEICECVDRYNLVKKFTEDIEDTYSFYLFSQFSASIIVIGFACIQFYLVDMWSVKFYLIVIWIITMTWEVFLYCYFGSLLYFESLTFVTDVYLTDWLDLDQRSQKAYLIIMENTKIPLMIRAGKIVELSLGTFATIMRRSYSLLAVCNKLL